MKSYFPGLSEGLTAGSSYFAAGGTSETQGGASRNKVLCGQAEGLLVVLLRLQGGASLLHFLPCQICVLGQP